MKNILKFFLLVSFILATFAIILFDLDSYMEVVRGYIESLGPFAPVGFVLFYAGGAMLFLPGTPFSIASGLLFGKLMGTLYAVIGQVLGATGAFFISRFLGRGFVEDMCKYFDLGYYDELLKRKGLIAVLFMRVIPLFPFNGINFVAGVSKIRYTHFLLATLIGVIPGTFILVYFGASVAVFDVRSMIISFALFLFLIFLYPILRRVV
ncbi:MAG: TVP38/TMEM64 family protein [Candidatus Woesearchaeota archaeon]